MADQYNTDDTVYTGANDPAYTGTEAREAYPNHGVDGHSDHDPAKGAGLGAVGGAVVGALAGGPVGAVIGAIAGGAASGAGVAAVDKHDNDNSPGETTDGSVYADGTQTVPASGSVYNTVEDGGTVYDRDSTSVR